MKKHFGIARVTSDEVDFGHGSKPSTSLFLSGVLQDRILVAIVKVFRIIDAVSAASTSRNIDLYAEREPKLPPAVYTSYLLNRLNSLKSALSPDILNESMKIQFLYSQTVVFETQSSHSAFTSETIRSYISYVEASINDLLYIVKLVLQTGIHG
uniref:Uncharacterized protein n=1 Tax=Bionectria ochroleuca TaxID=29856 RepID=A0A8H7N8D2_BIOOC